MWKVNTTEREEELIKEIKDKDYAKEELEKLSKRRKLAVECASRVVGITPQKQETITSKNKNIKVKYTKTTPGNSFIDKLLRFLHT